VAKDPEKKRAYNRAYNREWRKKNKDHQKKYFRDWYKKNAQEKMANSRRWYAENRRLNRDYKYLDRYGLTLAEVERQFATQRGICPICLLELPPLGLKKHEPHVDHDHKTGALRGVLHGTCNNGLGMMRDSAEAMRRAADYVEQGGVWHKAETSSTHPDVVLEWVNKD
jgi:hypothetical protein